MPLLGFGRTSLTDDMFFHTLSHCIASSDYKQHNYKTIVMGASFRNVSESTACNAYGLNSVGYRADLSFRRCANIQTDEIMELAGCDFLTISPSLLDKLQKSNDKVTQHLSVEKAQKEQSIEKVSFIDNEPEFRWALLQDQMAFDKLHEGIYKFAADAVTLKDILKEKLQQ